MKRTGVFTVITLIFTTIVQTSFSFTFAQLKIIPTEKLSDSIHSSEPIILFGEQHLGKQRKAIHKEWFEICELNNIDTVFIEQPYSVYLNAMIDLGSDYMQMSPFTESSSKVLIPVDIEDDLKEALLAIESVFMKNNLVGSTYDLENEVLYSDYRKSKRFDKEYLLGYIDRLQKDVAPTLKFYKWEFGKLLEMMRKTYTIFSAEELSGAYLTKERDSLMATEIETYLVDHKVIRWAGLFGAYHISHSNDRMYEAKFDVSQNMYHQLINRGNVFANGEVPMRVIYKSYAVINEPSSKVSSNFVNRYDAFYRRLGRKNVVVDFRNGIWFWITKK